MWKNIKNFLKKTISMETFFPIEQPTQKVRVKRTEPKIKQFKRQINYRKKATYR